MTFGPGQERLVKILNRILTLQLDQDEDVVIYEIDPRHADILISEFGLEYAKPFDISPTNNELTVAEYEESKILESTDATQFKSAGSG